MKAARGDVVSATEIASWAWCPESWRLEARGEVPGNRDELCRGHEFHTRAAGYEVAFRRGMRLGRWLLVFALLLAVLWLALIVGVDQ
ncbi:MAG: hypothetical protein U0871_15450 [Gemmataceae bacterium]